MTNQEIFLYWIKERLEIFRKKERGDPKPWTKDPILQRYRFCNVSREDDTVTQWIKKYWRDPCDMVGGKPNELMPLAMVVARTVNWPETLAAIGFPTAPVAEWMEQARRVMKHRREIKQKVWTGAYLVSTNGNKMDKIDYIIDRVWKPFFQHGRYPTFLEPLENYWGYLLGFDGLGSFMAAQVVCDLKYTFWLKMAPDWGTWAALGPGSKRGINRYRGHPVNDPIRQERGLEIINEAQVAVLMELGIELHAQDVQNCFCEYDKYLRVKNGEGKPRSGYDGI